MDFFITEELINAVKLVTEGRPAGSKNRPKEEIKKTKEKITKLKTATPVTGRTSDMITCYFGKELNEEKFKKLLSDAYFKYIDLSVSEKIKGEYDTKGSKSYAGDIKKLAGKDPKTAKAIIDTVVDVEALKPVVDEEDGKVKTYVYRVSLKSVSNKSFNQAFKDSFDYTWSTAPLYDIIRGQTTAPSMKPEPAVKVLLDANKKLISDFKLLDTEVPNKKTK